MVKTKSSDGDKPNNLGGNMIFNVPFDVRNIDNKIQISLSQNTKAKQRIKREGVNEYTKDA